MVLPRSNRMQQDKAVLAAIATTVELVRRDRLDRLSGRLAPHSGLLKREWEVKLGDEYIPVSILDGMISVPLEADLCDRRRRACHRCLGVASRGDCLAWHDRQSAGFRSDTSRRKRDSHWRGKAWLSPRAPCCRARPRWTG